MNLLAIIDFYVKNSLDMTGVNYDDKLCHFDFFGGKSLTINTITDYCTYRTLQGVKNATINRELTIVRSAVNFYNKHHDEQIKNPLNGFKLFEEEFIPCYLTVRQCQDLLTHAKGYNGNDLLYHFINLLLNTGCRRGELLKLEWRNVHLEQRYLTVLNSLSKNRKTIHKPLNDSAVQSLQALKHNNPSEWVFYNEQTGQRRVTFQSAFKKAVERADIGQVRIHDLRHTFASVLVQQGTPIYHVMQLLGHSDIKTTQKYAHLGRNNLQDVVKSLPNFG
ncbi:Tyrosine recombinase XerC [Moraxella caprae]|uniref:Tyrosine recombinase XerC n=1 Tax=Moraxella caprae TaxID=90240 RepID=A0A378R0G0_9GAMM|nr:site-specific integrase [Moraxella caprae]STZ08289.1 Tyrosine recombinase XerC [Moraxella caprae]